jgi:pimeloyl-ACP methyl ester carboxylesterase
MYQTNKNESVIRRVIYSVFFVLVISTMFLPAAGNKNRNNNGDVEQIYNNIRYATPVYEGTESIVTFENEGLTLVCTLTIPNTRKKAPIVITLNGFNGDRNDAVIPGTDEPFFKRVARMLAEQGLASLRVDFRGSGDSDGEYNITTFSTQISDTIAALDFICSDLKHLVDSNSIGIIGFSQGGLVGSVAAAKDKRVDALVLWSPLTNPPRSFQGLLLEEGIKQGLALPDGGSAIFGIYVGGQYVYWDAYLGKAFFEDIFKIDPLAEIKDYKEPMMVIVGSNDPIIWPQPAVGKLYLKYHPGSEKLVVLDADHAFNYWEGPEPQKLHDAIYWSAAWFISTIK